MPRINGQILVYVAIGAVLLLVGLNSIRGEKSGSEVFAAASPNGKEYGSGGKRSGGFEINAGGRKLIVDVAGAVRRPGVYRFEHGARVIDAIERAGGETGNAVVGAINRAATLTDGQQVVVPSSGGTGGPATAGVLPGGSSMAPDAPVSLGSATQEQLEEIDGIGPVTAQKIIEFRDSQGGLGSVDELDQISGIGPVTMESLRSALAP
ncbi:MAG: competence protein ComEA [Actinomycetota bacterium]|jgi:competence protein ComEA|nr:competence protein ComEA [Actinomycetota bacterium]